MPYPRGTEKYRLYWEVRAQKWSRKDAIAYAEAQSGAVAVEDDKTIESCRNMFDNCTNFQGFPQADELPEIPEDWRELPWPDLRALAERVSDLPIKSRADAEAAVLTALA